MSDNSSTKPPIIIANFESVKRDLEETKYYAPNQLELTSVLYEEGRFITFEKKLGGDRKTIISYHETDFNAENDYKPAIKRYVATEKACRYQHPEAFQ